MNVTLALCVLRATAHEPSQQDFIDAMEARAAAMEEARTAPRAWVPDTPLADGRAHAPLALHVSGITHVAKHVLFTVVEPSGDLPHYVHEYQMTVLDEVWGDVESDRVVAFVWEDGLQPFATSLSEPESFVVLGGPFNLARSSGSGRGTVENPALFAGEAIYLAGRRNVWPVHRGVVHDQRGNPICIETNEYGHTKPVACDGQPVAEFLDALRAVEGEHVVIPGAQP